MKSDLVKRLREQVATRALLLEAAAAIEGQQLNSERYLWLRQYLHIAQGEPGSTWTCWLYLDIIPYRWEPGKDNAEEMLDSLIARFPLDNKEPA